MKKKNSQEINVFDENDIIGTLKLQGRKNIFKPDNDLEENYWFSLNDICLQYNRQISN